MKGKLILCATPIGNLKDVTLRVLELLGEADLIACEDTRHSLGFLNHYDIKAPLTSYHEHNKYRKAETLIEIMRAGKNVALITDAGTPGISDPGEVLVKRCHEEGIIVTSLPGACACITALTLSGMNARRFAFEGFLPYGNKERKEVLKELSEEVRTFILYEAPHHLQKTLGDLKGVLGGERHIVLCRELTKQFEEVLSFTLEEALDYYNRQEPRGEYVLVIEGMNPEDKKKLSTDSWLSVDIKEHMNMYLEKGMDKKTAMKSVASDRGISRRDVYNMLLNT